MLIGHRDTVFPSGTAAARPFANDDPHGMNVNVGIISGGSGAIIVPEHAQAKVSMRFTTLEQQSHLRGKVRDIAAKHNRDGVRVELSDSRGFLPFRESPENTKLFELVQSASKELGQNITGMTTRGPGDAGVTASAGVPTICGMGPIGANLHTDQEYMEAASLPQHAKLTALSIIMASQVYSFGTTWTMSSSIPDAAIWWRWSPTAQLCSVSAI